MRRAIAVTGLTGALLLPVLAVAPSASAYGADRMQLICAEGRTIERSNGMSWWGVGHQAGYVTQRLAIDGLLVHQNQGTSTHGERFVCTGTSHTGQEWVVDLIRTR